MPAYLASSERSSILSRNQAVLAMRRMPAGACLIIFGAHCDRKTGSTPRPCSASIGMRLALWRSATAFTSARSSPCLQRRPSARAADRVAEQFGLSDLPTGILFGMIIASLAIGYFLPGLDAVLGFWRSLSSPAARRDLGDRRFNEHRQPGVCGLIFGCVVRAFVAFLRRVKTL